MDGVSCSNIYSTLSKSISIFINIRSFTKIFLHKKQNYKEVNRGMNNSIDIRSVNPLSTLMEERILIFKEDFLMKKQCFLFAFRKCGDYPN